MMSENRRLCHRDQASTKSVQRVNRKVRSRLGSISLSNGNSTDGDDDTLVRKCLSVKSVVAPIKDNEKGLRSFRRKNKVGTSLAERDVIDGFLILSFASYQDLEKEVKESEDLMTTSESEVFTESHQSDADSKEDEETRNALEKIESLLTSEKSVEDQSAQEVSVEVPIREKPKEVPIFPSSKELPIITSQLSVKVVKVKPEEHQKICDTAEEEKKVPPDLESPESETPKRDDAPAPTKPPTSPFPLKPTSHFLPLQNGPVQQPEPSAAVAAVTVTASTTNPATVPSSNHLGPTSNQAPLPSSTSPAGGVPFPSSLLSQEEFPVSPTVVSTCSKTASPILGPTKSYDSSAIKSHRSSNSDVVHSLPYPICSSYSDYTVNYSSSQYSSSKHSYHSQDGRETTQRTSNNHHPKVIANNYYHHSHQQPVIDPKYPSKESVSRNSSKVVVPCDGYKNESFLGNSYENKNSDYCIGQVYATSDKPCDPQYVYSKKTSSNNVYSYKTNELLNTQNSSENAVKCAISDKPKIVNESYANVNKAKVPNRTTYYQSIVNKTHSRHKSSRRVLPASAYEKPVINSYSSPAKQQDLLNVQGSKYSSQHYSSETKKSDYYQPVTTTTTPTANSYSYSNHKPDSQQSQISNHSSSHSNRSDSSYTNSKNYSNKVNSEICTSAYSRDKPVTSTTYNPTTKSYSYYASSKSYSSDVRNKTNVDIPSPYVNSDYYQKSNVTYSKPVNFNSSVSDVYKNSNHVSENTNYSNKNGSYQQHSRGLNDKNRNYYQSQESSYKSYHSESVPKQNIEESRGYKINSDSSNSYSNYGNSSSLKPKELAPKPIEALKPVPLHEQSNLVEPIVNIHPTVCEASSSYYPSPSLKDKNNYYTHSDPPHYIHRRTPPPVTKPQTSFEPLKFSSKESESFRISSTTAISSYSQRASVSSPGPLCENSSKSVAKTLWSPTASTPTTVTNAPNREIITASSRDSHSSHSNSSISSLSQLSQSLGSGVATTSQQSSKEYGREGRSSSSNGHSRSSSRDETSLCVTTAASASTSSSVTTTSTVTTTAAAYGVSGSLTSLIFSKPSWSSPSSSSVLSQPSSHLTPPSSGRVSPPVPSVLPLAPSLPSSYHPVAGPHVMFASPLSTGAGPLASPSLPPFGDQDLLRRELDTRFLASQDRSINVPPPPYLRTEMHQHQHQHTHMHQHSPFLPPPIGATLLPPSAAHLYDKFPKVDSSFYGRSALGLPTYPLSPLLAPGSATATPTPFAPPGHLAAFQPKISPLVKAKTVKSGRWCAMHVRISWEIYHHQQKQQAESQKGGSGSATKTVPDLLRPPNHLFGSLPRPHELGFSSPLLSSATSLHGRSPYDVSPQHPGFLGPSAAHLGMSPFARPNYPGLGVPGNSFGGLGSLGLASAGMLAGRELGPGYLLGQDPWSRLHRTPPNFPSPSAMTTTSSSWGGLKAEAERDRLQRREEQEKEKMKKAEADKIDKSKEIKEKREREQEKQKERDRENRERQLSHSADSLRNGDSSERSSREREWERSNRERRESSRSPLRNTTTTHNKSDATTYDHQHHKHQQDIKVKEEKKEEDLRTNNNNNKEGSPEPRTKSSEPPPSVNDYMSRAVPGLPPPVALAEQQARISQVPPPHFWNPIPPTSLTSEQRYRAATGLELQHPAARELDREQLMQKYASLSSVMHPLIPAERYREAELERQAAYERSKLPPPPLRPNDPPYVPAPGLPPTGGLFAPMSSNPFLNSLSYPPRTKPGSPGAGIGNGIPPPLIPCVSQGGSPGTTPSPLHLKLGNSTSSSNADSSREHYQSKDRRELGSSSTEIESQSR